MPFHWHLCVLPGNGSALVRLLQEGTCRLEDIGSYSEDKLRHLLEQCDIPFGAEDSKVSVPGSHEYWYPGNRLGGGPLSGRNVNSDIGNWQSHHEACACY